MALDHGNPLDQLLLYGIHDLDITKTQYDSAVNKYTAVGQWLADEASPLHAMEPQIFAQGSLAIGTALKPLGREEFDLDLVCRLQVGDGTRPEALKHLVGARLRDHAIYREMLSEKNRCWQLNYAGEFHMDLLPAKPRSAVAHGTMLLVPDKALECWKETDPKAFAAWFIQRAATAADGSDKFLRAEIEPPPPAPSGNEKWPLQVIVQLLKRHRNLMFQGDKDAPISVILTTLAGRGYSGEPSIVDGMSNVLDIMFEALQVAPNQIPVVLNPVNPMENFADKWPENPRKVLCFRQWVQQARRDLMELRQTKLSELADPLASWVGNQQSRKALRSYATSVQRDRNGGRLAVSAEHGRIVSSSVGLLSPPHTFYGK